MLLLLALAQAQDALLPWSDEDGTPIELLSADPAAPADDLFFRGMGAPTITSDGEQFVLYFETQLTPEAAQALDVSQCGNARVWGIGRATSTNGIDWIVDDGLVLSPQGGQAFDACVVAQPEVAFDGETWHLWYKAEQVREPCPEGEDESQWGCARTTGIGYASSTDGLTWTRAEQPVIPVRSDRIIGFPQVTATEDSWQLILSDIPNITLYTAPDPEGPWAESADSTILSPGAASWVSGEVLRPSSLCDATELGTDHTVYAIGRQLEATDALALGRFQGPSLTSLGVDPDAPFYQWNETDSDAWLAYDAVRIDGEVVVFYASADREQDPVRRRIGVATTGDVVGWDAQAAHTNICRAQDIPNDTAEPLDTAEISIPDEEDTGSPSDRPCQCQSGPATPGVAWLSMLGLGMFIRRRRR